MHKTDVCKCADITFTDTTLSSSDYADNCKNNSGVQVGEYTGPANIIANVSDCSAQSHGDDHDHEDGDDDHDHMDSSSSAAAASATSTGAAAQATMLGGLMLGAVGAIGLAVL